MKAMKSLMRLGRYLINHPRMVFEYHFQGQEYEGSAYTDSDWAGCHRTGKSTSGGCLMRDGHFIKSWSKTQQGVTLSSAEAELVAMNKAASEVLGALSMYEDLGESRSGGSVGRGSPVPLRVGGHQDCGNSTNGLWGAVYGDSSAALAISNRKGCGNRNGKASSWPRPRQTRAAINYYLHFERRKEAIPLSDSRRGGSIRLKESDSFFPIRRYFGSPLRYFD